jgi:hypothetical protein
MKFKIGDRVKVVGNCCNHNYRIGSVKTINKLYRSGSIQGYHLGGDNYVEDEDIVLAGKEIKMKDTKWGVKYEMGSDPVEFFKTRKKAEERIFELMDDKEVVKSSIYLFEVAKIYKAKRPIAFILEEEK